MNEETKCLDKKNQDYLACPSWSVSGSVQYYWWAVEHVALATGGFQSGNLQRMDSSFQLGWECPVVCCVLSWGCEKQDYLGDPYFLGDLQFSFDMDVMDKLRK